jgi:lipopolysaccharide/colanic/teichoic acid biosynthesis glycosyltransferase
MGACIKRTFDVLGVVVALVVLAPLMALVAFLILVTMGPPVLFRQQRPGLRSRPFTVLKFRTMTDARDADGNPLPDQNRLTPVGRFLRMSSLDELPELFNVLRGEMSLVGPRPLLMQYLQHYTPEQARRHDVKPGITGWAQVKGRNDLSWEERFKLDTWYVDHATLAVDLKVLLLTVGSVITRQGISAEGHSTMPRFKGTSGSEGKTR